MQFPLLIGFLSGASCIENVCYFEWLTAEEAGHCKTDAVLKGLTVRVQAMWRKWRSLLRLP